MRFLPATFPNRHFKISYIYPNFLQTCHAHMYKTTQSILFIVLLGFSASYSQDKIIDSLKIVLSNPKLHDTTRLRSISNTMDANYHDNYDKNYLYLNDMMGKLALKNYQKK